MVEAALVFLGACIIAGAFILISVRAFQVNPDLVRKVFRYSVILVVGTGFSLAAVAIGFRLSERNKESFSKSSRAVAQIWGGRITQSLPSFTMDGKVSEQYLDDKSGEYKTRTKSVSDTVAFKKHDANFAIKSNIRKKGLLKFAGYNLIFTGTYSFENTGARSSAYQFHFPVPSEAGNIADIGVQMNGKAYTGDRNLADGVDWSGSLQPGETVSFTIRYTAQGTGGFSYGQFSEVNPASIQIADYQTTLSTDFEDVIVPDGSMSPSEKAFSGETGTMMVWKSSNLILAQNIGMEFRISGNYGELFSKIFFYSPLTIFLFLAFLMIFSVSQGIRLHPVHFIFITAGFFVFYLLGSYLVSYMHILAAILVSMAVSSAITAYYALLINKDRTLAKVVLLCLGIFQWFFSTAFFFPEHTGLLITLASIGALVVLMKITSRTAWEEKW